MVKRSTLLKVISIILIILGAFNVLGSILIFAMGDVLAESYAMLGLEAPTMLANVISVAGAVIILGSGIMGVASKSKKTILIVGVILCAYYLLSIVYSAVTIGFSPINLAGLIMPILYMWGWYQTA